MKQIIHFLILLFLSFPNYSCTPAGTKANQQTKDDCGTYRWEVKTLTDLEGMEVFNAVASNSSIEKLIQEKRTAPNKERDNSLRYEDEKRKVKLDVTLVQIKLEQDMDFHIVLKSGPFTMVAEVPNGECGAFSNHPELRKYFDDLRTRIVNEIGFSPTSKFKKINKEVTIEGIPFWDELEVAHKPKGSAENQIEIHPITNIIFR